MKIFDKNFPFIKEIYHKLNNKFIRKSFVKTQLAKLEPGGILLDAGCGSQRYRGFTSHLVYKAQDFGKYESDENSNLLSLDQNYKYGDLDYIGDIWSIAEKDNYFDAILCTEVFEHIPYPNETVKEFYRLLKKDGTLILTVPAISLRHFDPYYFYSGFSDRWINHILDQHGFLVEKIEFVGDYYSFMATEIARTMVLHSIFSKLILLPSFLYYYFKNKTSESANTLCSAYHVVAKRK